MQNTYIKELAIKSYQEERAIEYAASKKQPFHPPSFTFGFIIAILFIQFV